MRARDHFRHPRKFIHEKLQDDQTLKILYLDNFPIYGIKTTLLLSDKNMGGNTIYHGINFPPSPSWLVYLLVTKSITLVGVKITS